VAVVEPVHSLVLEQELVDLVVVVKATVSHQVLLEHLVKATQEETVAETKHQVAVVVLQELVETRQ
jgi:hypothetical protein